MTRRLTVVIKEPNQPARVDTITSDLRTLQDIVGGYIESVSLAPRTGVAVRMIVNEDGRIRNLAPNFIVHPYGVIRGAAIILAARTTIAGNFVSLTPAQAAELLTRFSTTPVGPLPAFV